MILGQGRAIKEGFLTKQGKVRKNWKKRFFVLTAVNLQYYRSRTVRSLPQSPLDSLLSMFQDGKPAGTIPVKNTSIELVPKKECGKDLCLSISTSDRTFLIYADTSSELEDWMQHLERVQRS